MIGKTVSHYRVQEKIGEGGMGVVYRAHDEYLDRDVALKVLPTGTLTDRSSQKRLRREAQRFQGSIIPTSRLSSTKYVGCRGISCG